MLKTSYFKVKDKNSTNDIDNKNISIDQIEILDQLTPVE